MTTKHPLPPYSAQRCRRFTAVVFAAALTLALTGCNDGNDEDSQSIPDNYFEEVTPGGEIEAYYKAMGPYAVASAPLHSADAPEMEGKVWYPAEMETRNRTWPIVVLANGSNTPYVRYEPVFEHLASWGFVVVGNDDHQPGKGSSSVHSLNAILAQNEDGTSMFFHKLDTANIGISGASQGGAGAINAVTAFESSPRFTSLFTNSAPYLLLSTNLGWAYEIPKINIPYFMVAGTEYADAEIVIPLAKLQENFEAARDDLKLVMARRAGTDHDKMLVRADGYMTAWFCWTLQGDERAGGVFSGASPEIERNTNWVDVRIQN